MISGYTGGTRHAVVGAEDLREPVHLEEPHEDRAALRSRRAAEAAAGQEVATEAVLHGERKAVPPIAEAELPLVVGGPDHVGRRHRRERPPRMAAPRAAPARGNQAVAS
jgi:hypothetical protein